jgi:hypothetical protein
MNTHAISSMMIMLLVALVGPPVTFAQSAAANDRSPVSVVFDGGLATGSPGAGPAIGGRLTFDLNDRMAIEGAGSWAGRGSGADAASLTASLLVNLTRADRKAVPYAAIGGGFYRAMFDMGDRRFFGMMGSEYAGTQLVPIAGMHGVGMMQGYTGNGRWSEPWSGPTWDVSQMPMFYLQRMGTLQVPADGRWGMHRFSDPAISLGGGMRMDITDRVYFRPELRALVLVADGRSSTSGLFTVGVGYRF